MANYSRNIERLKKRRSGADTITALNFSQRSGLEYFSNISPEELDLLQRKSYISEGWESRAKDNSATRYAIGSMQSVGDDYTRVSLKTAERIQNQLQKRLLEQDINVDCKLQGSVPLDIHIKAFSDVDLLAVETAVLRYDSQGVKASTYFPTDKDSRATIFNLRKAACIALEAAFPAANVNGQGSKSLRITGGSLQREVDVVPAIWWDTENYQLNENINERGVVILDNDKYQEIFNSPFVHIEKIRSRCDNSNGGLRKSIRLLKNLKADSEEDGIKINFSSYDIASVMFHADVTSLRHSMFYELAVLGETQRWLNYICTNREYAKRLEVPNGLRKIFERDEQFDELEKLTRLTNTLVDQIAEELGMQTWQRSDLGKVRQFLNESLIL